MIEAQKLPESLASVISKDSDSFFIYALIAFPV